MHRRGKYIAFHSENQFTHLGISFRPDISQFFIKRFSSPRGYSPAFIINKDTSVLNRRSLRNVVYTLNI